MTESTDGQRWEVLNPAIRPTDPQQYLRAAVEWHFGEETGSAFWLRRARTLDFDPLTTIHSYDDLRRFPNIVDELREVPVEDLIPRGYGPNPPAPRVFESGGTTGAPKRIIFMPDWLESALDRMEKGPQFAGRRPSNLLVAMPTGPHKAGSLYDYIAARQNFVKFSIDIDPRWVKKLISRGETDQAARYVEHVLDQIEHVLTSQDVGALVITPPLLLACSRRPQLVELINTKIELITWGGAHMTLDQRFELEQVIFPKPRFLSRYSSALILEGARQRPGTSPDEEIIYDPGSPVSTFLVVDGETGEQVQYGQRGQVIMNHVSKGMFLPNNLERDTAIRVPGPPGQIGDSVSAPKPVETFGGEAVIEGIY
ncbi:phenazine antibiotic biosynthesis protein [Frankia sp. R82]|uniref:phenazine antibiotic biosynthesis protein n=1 Tax=Frankia sp. R82 TaxID=2950553 RepID=UPI0020439FD5|nr:phenazine antibiotic biosynthesis protein [Frankia sp. R82]MCM3886695.1 phenazine antibiotic biosynthesis protein [Frankia sp. R82]